MSGAFAWETDMTLRDWATPLTMGSFVLIASTGVLMFFHLDSGLNKEAHEWLSWVLLLGVGLHATANLAGAKRHFQRRGAWAIVGVFVLILGLSFMPSPEEEKSGGELAMNALVSAPVVVLAQVSGKDVATVVAELAHSGVSIRPEQSLKQVLGDDRHETMEALGVIFAK